MQVSGWGSTREDMANEAVILQKVSVTTIDCGISAFQTFNPMHHFCAGTTTGSTGPAVGICTIDVGGPLAQNNMLVGIPFFHDPRACGRHPVSFLQLILIHTKFYF